MRILYYCWDEFNYEDCQDAMLRLGHEIVEFKADSAAYTLTEADRNRLSEIMLNEENGKRYFDLVYSFDFYPGLSEVCQSCGLPYISWVFDCPHYSLHSPTINNPVNRVYVFDKSLYREMKSKGIETVHYSPLGVNVQRLTEVCNELDEQSGGNVVYEHDVCFLGNLYDNEFNFYDQIGYFPEELKGYIDGIITAQERVFGVDFFSDPRVMTKEIVEELRKYIEYEKKGNYDLDYDKVTLDILRKKVTVNERHKIITEMGKNFDTVIYTTPGARPIENVANLGLAHYVTGMPRVFHRSKVNLNITLRSIISGVPLRVVDVLAAGGFLITSYTEEIAEYFTDGVELAIAMTPEEMIEKTAYYLEHDEERKRIAKLGQKKVFNEFSYTKLLQEILKV